MQTVCGEYIYYAPKNISFEVAEQTAIKRARIKALAEQYGTVIQSTTTTAIENQGESADMDISTLAFSEVRGVWLKDTRSPEVIFLAMSRICCFFEPEYGD